MKKFPFLLGLLLCAQVLLTAGPKQELEKAKILPKVICQDNPKNSYALFLPSAYSPEKEWPILYALDPGARGEVPVALFRKAAETYGFILIGSNDSRNGPWQPSIQAMIAIWNDTNDRFSIDKKRIYVTGFSGGSRAASIFARVIRHPVAGIIGCGAGLATNLIKPERIPPAYYLGIVGIVDFNFREMMLLRDQFEKHDVSHRFLVHSGGHEWPTEDICQRAIEWMDVIGIRNDIRAMDEGFIDTVFEKEQEIALSLESTGDLSHALSNYQVLLETFSTWKDTGPIQDKIQIIQKNEEYLKDKHAENRIRELEIQHLRKFGQVLSQIEKNSPPIEYIENVFANLGLEELKTKAAKRKAREESFMATRLLHGLEIDAYSKGWGCFQKEEVIKAIFFFAIAAKGGNEQSPMKKSIYYNLACAYARNQNNKKALENLKLAVEHGFDNVEHMEKDEDLASLQDTKGFQKIIKKLNKK